MKTAGAALEYGQRPLFRMAEGRCGMKTLVVYYSLEGNTAMVAEKLGEALGAELLRLEPEKAYPDHGASKFLWGGKSAVMGEKPALRPYSFLPEDYDRVIIGFPVWAGIFAPPIRSFVSENLDALKGKLLAAYACEAGSGGERALQKLKKLLGIESFAAEMVLIDPKSRPSDGNDARLREFCRRLKS